MNLLSSLNHGWRWLTEFAKGELVPFAVAANGCELLVPSLNSVRESGSLPLLI